MKRLLILFFILLSFQIHAGTEDEIPINNYLICKFLPHELATNMHLLKMSGFGISQTFFDIGGKYYSSEILYINHKVEGLVSVDADDDDYVSFSSDRSEMSYYITDRFFGKTFSGTFGKVDDHYEGWSDFYVGGFHEHHLYTHCLSTTSDVFNSILDY